MTITTTTTSAITSAPALPRLVRHGVIAFWRELPRALVAGGVALLTAAPLGLALATSAPPWIRAAAVLPPALALTGVARVAVPTAAAERPDLRALRRLDPALGALLALGAVGATGCLVARGGSALAGVGAVLGALVLLVGPYALVYGVRRGRTGLAALRGGAVLVAYRPAWALTVLALGCLLGFAVAASVGVLTVVAVPLHLTITAVVAGQLLDDVDRAQANPTAGAERA